METAFNDAATGSLLAVEGGVLQLRDVGELPSAGGPPAQERLYRRAYGSAGANSRVGVQLPDTIWKVDWKADLGEGLRSQFVLVGEKAIIVQQEGAWRLFERGGKPVKQGARGEGDIVLDEENGAFYLQSHDGLISVRSSTTGAETLLLKCYLAEGFVRSVLKREGRLMIVHSLELPNQDSKQGREGEYCFLELLELGADARKDILGISSSTRSVKTLMGHFMPSLALSTENSIVVAGPDGLITLTADLKPERIVQGEFVPLTLAMSDPGRFYLLVRPKEGAIALWGLTLEGERFLNVPIPWTPVETFPPPILGFDDTIYLIRGDTLAAFSTDGRFLWREFAGGPIAGVVATAGGRVLVSAGHLLTTFDRGGERRVVFELPEDVIRTPAIPTDGGEVFLASDRALYRLVPAR